MMMMMKNFDDDDDDDDVDDDDDDLKLAMTIYTSDATTFNFMRHT
jgi:hypothetical protein